MNGPTMPDPATDSLASVIAEALRTEPWYNGHAWDAHQGHQYGAHCAVCRGDVDRIAQVAARAALAARGQQGEPSPLPYAAADEPQCGDPYHRHTGSCYLYATNVSDTPEPPADDTGEHWLDSMECNRPAHADGHHTPECYGAPLTPEGRETDPHYPEHARVWADGNYFDAVVIHREWRKYQQASAEKWESDSNPSPSSST